MQTKVQKWGNSLGLRIPRALADEVGVEAGSEVDLAVEHGELVVRPKQPSRYALHDLLGRITDENLHAEVETGEPLGREAW